MPGIDEARPFIAVNIAILTVSDTRTLATARRLFFATIIYLPLLWGALVADHATFR